MAADVVPIDSSIQTWHFIPFLVSCTNVSCLAFFVLVGERHWMSTVRGVGTALQANTKRNDVDDQVYGNSRWLICVFPVKRPSRHPVFACRILLTGTSCATGIRICPRLARSFCSHTLARSSRCPTTRRSWRRSCATTLLSRAVRDKWRFRYFYRHILTFVSCWSRPLVEIGRIWLVRDFGLAQFALSLSREFRKLVFTSATCRHLEL